MSKCFICNTEMEVKEIEYENVKSGNPNVKVKEKAKARVCPKCGEITFSYAEAKRLQELSKNY